VLDRRARLHAHFAWFAQRGDPVLVFDNTSTPVYAVDKVNGAQDLAEVDRLQPDLAMTIRWLAGITATPGSTPPSI
jgi:hypothetical protein